MIIFLLFRSAFSYLKLTQNLLSSNMRVSVLNTRNLMLDSNPVILDWLLTHHRLSVMRDQ